MDFNAVQPSSAPSPTEWTLAGMVTAGSNVQPKNAHAPMSSAPLPISTLVKEVQL